MSLDDGASQPAAANDQQNEERTAALKQLGLAMDSRGFRVQVSRPVQGPTFLKVANPTAGGLSENVTCKAGPDDELCYFYSWGQLIAPVRHAESAAERLVYVLSPLEVA
jgi:hypothetical protein